MNSGVCSDRINAMTVDVEDYFQVHAFSDIINPGEWNSYPSRVECNTLKILDTFARYDVRATFFVLGWVAKKFPKLTLDICSAGHHVGCHGFAHRAIHTGSAADFRSDIKSAKAVLEDAIGAAVTSYRAPSYSITAATVWALEILGEEGFVYDSSIFPVVHDNYGIPGAPRFPYVHMLSGGQYIREFPPSTIRFLGVNLPVAGGGYLRLFPYSITAWALRRINEVEQQPAMVYLHPWEFDPEQPRIPAKWKSRFRHYQNLESTEEKCRRLLEEFSWGPMEQVFPEKAMAGGPLGLVQQ
jgi:polysaccharide deacetylase family protein (PEP-CTERM system associated)